MQQINDQVVTILFFDHYVFLFYYFILSIILLQFYQKLTKLYIKLIFADFGMFTIVIFEHILNQ